MKVKRKDPFDLDILSEFWNQFKEQKIKEGIDKHVNILNQEYSLEGETIKLKVTNPIQEDIFEEFRAEIMQFLREGLKNDFLKLQVVTIKGQGKKMIYTNAEKFRHLSEKNPILRKLKDKMGFDPDF